ncbi:MAG: fimbrial assembly protein [Terracidiphilus sp.]|jgi:type IV pilus assembly protein PilN
MRITLNLATRPFADLGPAIKRLRIGMGLLALLSILLGLGLHAIHQKAEAARARDHSLDGQIAQITRERQSYQDLMRQPANAQVLKQAAVLNKLFDEKAFSWTLAMEDLETVLPGGVQVTNLEPARAKDGHITLRLRVLGPRNRAVDLVRNLEHSRRFLLPRIVGENAEGSDRPGQRLEPVSAADRVEFELLAEYNPATSGEVKATRKPSPKSAESRTESAEAPRPRVRVLRPLPLKPPGQGRPPYTGPGQTLRPAPMIPRSAPPPNPNLSGKPNPGSPQ